MLGMVEWGKPADYRLYNSKTQHFTEALGAKSKPAHAA
jgi:hypothetical protein